MTDMTLLLSRCQQSARHDAVSSLMWNYKSAVTWGKAMPLIVPVRVDGDMRQWISPMSPVEDNFISTRQQSQE